MQVVQFTAHLRRVNCVSTGNSCGLSGLARMSRVFPLASRPCYALQRLTALPNPAHSSHIRRFEQFELDLRTAEIFKEGKRIKLQEQPCQVLVLLIERPGELVSREELRKKLWPNDTFVDFDHGVNIAINKLRDALGDSPEKPRFIETLPRRGYRFIAPVNTPKTARDGVPSAHV